MDGEATTPGSDQAEGQVGPDDVRTETTTTTTETTETQADNPSTSAQEVVDEVHEQQAASAPAVQETTTATVHEVTDPRAGNDEALESQRQDELNAEREEHNARRVQQPESD